MACSTALARSRAGGQVTHVAARGCTWLDASWVVVVGDIISSWRERAWAQRCTLQLRPSRMVTTSVRGFGTAGSPPSPLLAPDAPDPEGPQLHLCARRLVVGRACGRGVQALQLCVHCQAGQLQQQKHDAAGEDGVEGTHTIGHTTPYSRQGMAGCGRQVAHSRCCVQAPHPGRGGGGGKRGRVGYGTRVQSRRLLVWQLRCQHFVAAY